MTLCRSLVLCSGKQSAIATVVCTAIATAVVATATAVVGITGHVGIVGGGRGRHDGVLDAVGRWHSRDGGGVSGTGLLTDGVRE